MIASFRAVHTRRFKNKQVSSPAPRIEQSSDNRSHLCTGNSSNTCDHRFKVMTNHHVANVSMGISFTLTKILINVNGSLFVCRFNCQSGDKQLIVVTSGSASKLRTDAFQCGVNNVGGILPTAIEIPGINGMLKNCQHYQSKVSVFRLTNHVVAQQTHQESASEF